MYYTNVAINIGSIGLGGMAASRSPVSSLFPQGIHSASTRHVVKKKLSPSFFLLLKEMVYAFLHLANPRAHFFAKYSRRPPELRRGQHVSIALQDTKQAQFSEFFFGGHRLGAMHLLAKKRPTVPTVLNLCLSSHFSYV